MSEKKIVDFIHGTIGPFEGKGTYTGTVRYDDGSEEFVERLSLEPRSRYAKTVTIGKSTQVAHIDTGPNAGAIGTDPFAKDKAKGSASENAKWLLDNFDFRQLRMLQTAYHFNENFGVLRKEANSEHYYMICKWARLRGITAKDVEVAVVAADKTVMMGRTLPPRSASGKVMQ